MMVMMIMTMMTMLAVDDKFSNNTNDKIKYYQQKEMSDD